jgi:hypothetical protein
MVYKFTYNILSGGCHIDGGNPNGEIVRVFSAPEEDTTSCKILHFKGCLDASQNSNNDNHDNPHSTMQTSVEKMTPWTPWIAHKPHLTHVF